MVNVNKFSELLNIQEKYRKDGYEIIPAIYEINFGKIGFVASKNGNDFDYEYAPYKNIVQNITEYNSEQEINDFYNLHKDHEKFSEYSFSRELKVGMLCYCEIDKSIINIAKMRISIFKSLNIKDSEVGKFLLAIAAYNHFHHLFM